MPTLTELCEDLRAEHDELDAIVAPLDEASWQLATPSPGWTIRDQIAHLIFADERATLAGRDPEAFEQQRRRDVADQGAFQRAMMGPEYSSGSGVLGEWRRARAEFLAVFSQLDRKCRVPWYGLPMSPASKVTARLMETWAHGQDVADTLGVERTATDRIRHVAHIGVGARKFSYMTNGRTPNETPIRVELVGPHGDRWVWGDEAAVDSVRGPALHFCLVITQRRHVADTRLEVVGPAAAEWIEIGQAFAGEPGAKRRPGQFAPLA